MTTKEFDTSSVLNVLEKSVNGSLQSPQDALAAAVHAIMLSAGFKLSEPSKEDKDGQSKLLAGWNSLGPNYYGYFYDLQDSGSTCEIKGVKIGHRFVVLGLNGDETVVLDIPVKEYTSESSFPIETSSKDLGSAFISAEKFEDLIHLFKTHILHKLTSGSTNSGYENTRSGRQEGFPRNNQQQSDDIPVFSSLQDNSRPGRENPFSVGRSDIDPLGGHHIPGPGDGTYVGPSHPMYSHRHDQENSNIFGGPQTLPRGAVPPGARFDPIGPFGNPPGRGGLGGPRRGFGGEPDNDEMSPPGFNNMFM
ncbi:PI31 proteasome regulator N-terminal-domain-containing protein [Phycomyces blakesleeanus]|uniref:Uncharacterized protein n=2 Tax=Phycomyces blakesleeanus TaxID=4837 RepID=A0A162N8I6_PHYB8|nr:hypothetical protein PHYBLDRAFT_181959 [Phycomyces blakesleeanus NRRL 1555(-)]OAD72098.1 hypothetical protein PHYBLDRAFT_181959 [Phycomyces blakesleeanus NRRL 1555(-)]|eukprot:XP_018290138.1 hypothetical protein PHYBLDRAFT_181959 [Phycomyces blakesleeanus NRRL 1555(-)]